MADGAVTSPRERIAPGVDLIAGDCLDVLPALAAESVHCVVTSPLHTNAIQRVGLVATRLHRRRVLWTPPRRPFVPPPHGHPGDLACLLEPSEREAVFSLSLLDPKVRQDGLKEQRCLSVCDLPAVQRASSLGAWPVHPASAAEQRVKEFDRMRLDLLDANTLGEGGLSTVSNQPHGVCGSLDSDRTVSVNDPGAVGERLDVHPTTDSTPAEIVTGVRLYKGDAMDVLPLLASESVHCVVTSPPYFNLRDYGLPPRAWPAMEYAPVAGCPPVAVPAMTCCLGLEPDPVAFVGHLLTVLREARRVLRRDGTAWVNLGDSYAAQGGCGRQGSTSQRVGRANVEAQTRAGSSRPPTGLKPKDLIGIPWRFALAAQADGWWLRSEVIWAKRNAMPSSVTDRPTTAHEQVFLLAKSPRYFYDADAIREPILYPEYSTQDDADRAFSRRRAATAQPRQAPLKRPPLEGAHGRAGHDGAGMRWSTKGSNPGGKNRRSVWWLGSQPFGGAHFATFPEKLVEPCILAGTSAGGCCSACGAPQRRVAERVFSPQADVSPERAVRGATSVTTLGWAPSCRCDAPVVPCTVLDPFAGSGTVGAVARTHGRDALLIEAQPSYHPLIRRRVAGAPAWQRPLALGGPR